MNTFANKPNGGRAPERAVPFGSWRRLYALVIAALALDIALLAWLTRHFR